MAELSLGQKLALLVNRQGQDETVLLAEAMQKGVGPQILRPAEASRVLVLAL